MSDELQVPTEVKKSRRQTAFYPVVSNTSNTKPFSKSAARRDSVLSLTSIEHLQYYFTKTGIAAKQKPGSKAKGMVPAIGGGHLRTPSAISGIPQLRFELPPSPMVPQPTGQPFFVNAAKDYQTDPEELLPGLVNDLERVSTLWALGSSEQRLYDRPLSSLSASSGDVDQAKPTPTIASPGEFDVLSVLQATTNAIRSVRNYLVALPDDVDSSLTTPTFRPTTLSHRPVVVSKPSKRNEDADDPLSRIRRSALHVLSALREIEEKYRLPMTDDSFEGASENGSGSMRSAAPSPNPHTSSDGTDSTASFNFSVMTVPGRQKPVQVWYDEEDDQVDEINAETERKHRWDEKLVLGGGWLYRSDVSFAQVEKERDIVGRYLDTVDSALFAGDNTQPVRGWSKVLNKSRKDRRSSSQSSSGRLSPAPSEVDVEPTPTRTRRTGLLLDTSMQALAISEEPLAYEFSPTEEVDEEHLPNWAKRTEFVEDPLGRAYALLVTLLPVELLHILPSPSETLTSTNLMLSLSSGQLLCAAYNAGVRKSKKPWGYINKAAVHDIAALEAEADVSNSQEGTPERENKRKAWTFRRTENLRLWAAALKLRYMIPLVTSSQLSGSATRTGTPASSPGPATIAYHQGLVPNLFDAAVVAKREQLWEEMLHDAVLLWMGAVVSEKRGEMNM